MKRIAILASVIGVVLAFTAPAYGQSATGDAYGHSGGGVLGAVNDGGGNNGSGGGVAGSGDAAPTQVVQAASSEGSLPFTGLDLGLLAVGGLVLVGVGVTLRRVARAH